MKNFCSLFFLKAKLRLLVIVLIIIISCRGKEIELPGPVVNACADGVKNQDETDIDCGGVCALCYTAPSCSPKINTFDMHSGTFPPSTFNSVKKSIYDGFFTLTGDAGIVTVVITFPETTGPAKSGIYKAFADPGIVIPPAKVIVRYKYGPDTFSASSGDVYVKYTAGSLNVTFCSLTFPSSSKTYNATGNLTYVP